MERPLSYWINLVAVNVKTDPLSIIAIGYECWKADHIRDPYDMMPPSVWHHSAKFFGNRCNCVPCFNNLRRFSA